MELKPIGVVKSAVVEEIDRNWGDHKDAEVHVNPELVPGLKGLKEFSHVIIVFHMHGTPPFDPATNMVRRPRGQADMPELGIFAQRAKHRPHPIGITPVKLVSVEGNVLKVQGLDAVDGTPVLDIKPYFPIFDRVDGVTTPEWVDRLMNGYF